jgi:predicted lipoprotein with Yx(FWY)xxD motif
LEATELPAGLKVIERQEGLLIAAKSNNHLIYTPRNGARLVKASVGAAAEEFQPVLAPAMAKVSGDWSVLTTAAGQRQYAFRGMPLFKAPDSIPDREILSGRDWSPVVVHKAPGTPPEIRQQLTLAGQSYATATGRTLYGYSCMVGGMVAGAGGGARVAPASCDEAGDPAGYMVSLCGDAKECARRWKPYLAAANARRVGNWAPVEITYPMFTDPRGVLYPSDAPKVRVWAFRGRPLFTYYEDEKPGDIWGDGTKGLWGSAFSALLIPGEAGAFGE